MAFVSICNRMRNAFAWNKLSHSREPVFDIWHWIHILQHTFNIFFFWCEQNLVVFFFFCSNRVPDAITGGLVSGKPISDSLPLDYLSGEFIPTIQERGAKVNLPLKDLILISRGGKTKKNLLMAFLFFFFKSEKFMTSRCAIHYGGFFLFVLHVRPFELCSLLFFFLLVNRWSKLAVCLALWVLQMPSKIMFTTGTLERKT